MNPPTALPAVMTGRQVCQELVCSIKTVYRLVARRKLKRVPGIRHLRVTRRSFEEFIDRDDK